MFKLMWPDFKPHFDFDQSYTLEEFLDFYKRKDLDSFFEKLSKHNDAFEKLRVDAESKNEKLRYMAVLENGKTKIRRQKEKI